MALHMIIRVYCEKWAPHLFTSSSILLVRRYYNVSYCVYKIELETILNIHMYSAISMYLKPNINFVATSTLAYWSISNPQVIYASAASNLSHFPCYKYYLKIHSAPTIVFNLKPSDARMFENKYLPTPTLVYCSL